LRYTARFAASPLTVTARLLASFASAREARTSHAFSCVEVYGVRPRAASTRSTARLMVAFGALPSLDSETSAAASRSDEP